MENPFVVGHYVGVAGGVLHVARAGAEPAAADAVVLLAHGITASHLAWRRVARELVARRPTACVLAPDLRGRARSAAVGRPHGIAAHIADLIAVLDDAAAARVVLGGHSMGAFVVARLAAEWPDRAVGVVLIDGGLPIPAPAELDPDRVLDAVLGPAIARLRMTFRSPTEYVAFWQAHPAFAGRWNEDMEAYVRADLSGDSGAWRSVVSEAAVRADGADLLRDYATVHAVDHIAAAVRLLRAPRGLLDDEKALIPRAVFDAFAAAHPGVAVEEVDDVNHYTITLGDGAARVAAALAAAIDDARAAG